MLKKCAVIFIALSVLMMSVPKTAFAFLNGTNAVCAESVQAENRMNVIDISKNIVKGYFSYGKLLANGLCYFDAVSGQQQEEIKDYYGILTISMSNDRIFIKKSGHEAFFAAKMSGAQEKDVLTDKHRRRSFIFPQTYLIILSALHKGSVPGDIFAHNINIVYG